MIDWATHWTIFSEYILTSKGAILTASLAALGWLGAYLLNYFRDERTKRNKATLDHAARQIEEFYAPLVSLTDQLSELADIFDDIKKNNSGIDIDTVFYMKFFYPVHQQINGILSTKLHLFEGNDIPPSFSAYFRHYAAEYAIKELNNTGHRILGVVNVPPYPSSFYWDVRKGFQSALNRYEKGVRRSR